MVEAGTVPPTFTPSRPWLHTFHPHYKYRSLGTESRACRSSSPYDGPPYPI